MSNAQREAAARQARREALARMGYQWEATHFAMIAGDVKDADIMAAAREMARHFEPYAWHRNLAFIGLSEWEVAESAREAAEEKTTLLHVVRGILVRWDRGDSIPCIVAQCCARREFVMATLAEYQRIPADHGQHEEDAAEARHAARVDRVGHSSVQAWSAGPIFPAVIARVERWAEFPSYTQWLNTDGRRSAPRDAYPRGSHVHYLEERAAFYERPMAERFQGTSYELIIAGYREEFAERADAEQVAQYVCQGGRINAERYAEVMA